MADALLYRIAVIQCAAALVAQVTDLCSNFSRKRFWSIVCMLCPRDG